jgi:hypothetical protein
MDAVGAVRSSRQELPKDVMNCKLQKGEVAVLQTHGAQVEG